MRKSRRTREPRFGRWPFFGRIGPGSVKAWPMSTQTGRVGPRLAQIRPKLASFGKTTAKIGPIRPSLVVHLGSSVTAQTARHLRSKSHASGQSGVRRGANTQEKTGSSPHKRLGRCDGSPMTLSKWGRPGDLPTNGQSARPVQRGIPIASTARTLSGAARGFQADAASHQRSRN